jgi:RNA polymerase sigma factor (sigma-70 family)
VRVTAAATSRSDEELAVLVGQGDDSAFAELYERHFTGTHDFALRIVRDRDLASDVVQGAFTRAWENLREGEPPRRFKAWLYTIARNRAIDELRRGGRQVSMSAGEDEEGAGSLQDVLADEDRLSDPSAAADDADLSDLVWTAASSLSPQDYSLLDMHVRQSLTAEEMAEALDVRSGTLYTRLSRLRDNLEDALSTELLRRRGREDCPELGALIASLPEGPLERNAHRRVQRHVAQCDVCTANRRRFVSAAELLAALVPLPVAPGLQEQIFEGVRESMEQGPPPGSGSGGGGGGAGAAAGIGGGAGVLGVPTAWVAGAAAAVLALIVVGALLLTRGGGLSDPSGAASTSHTVALASSDPVVVIAWEPHTDAAGFSVVWDQALETLPDTTVDLPGTETGAESPELADGDWYFHLRTQGADGEWTSTLHLGPFVIASAPDPAAATPEATPSPEVTASPTPTETSTPLPSFPAGDYPVFARFVRDADSPVCSPVGEFSDRLVLQVDEAGGLTLLQPSGGHANVGEIAADGTFAVAQQNPPETYEGAFELPAGGSARHTFTDGLGCTSTWTVEFIPPPEIEVIEFEGLLLPTDQLRIAGPDACDGDHWHGGPVVALDGTVVNDPAPGVCGFGKVDETPVRLVPAF